MALELVLSATILAQSLFGPFETIGLRRSPAMVANGADEVTEGCCGGPQEGFSESLPLRASVPVRNPRSAGSV
jgi:hypothetical protein